MYELRRGKNMVKVKVKSLRSSLPRWILWGLRLKVAFPFVVQFWAFYWHSCSILKTLKMIKLVFDKQFPGLLLYLRWIWSSALQIWSSLECESSYLAPARTTERFWLYFGGFCTANSNSGIRSLKFQGIKHLRPALLVPHICLPLMD